MSSIVTLSDDDVAPIREMLDQMEANGTLRSRNPDARSMQEMRAEWMQGFASQKAVTRFIEEEYDIPCSIDTRAYDTVRDDSGDIYTYTSDDGVVLDAEPVEIKKTSSYSKHVAVTRAEANLIEQEEPIVYVRTSYDGGTIYDSASFEVVGWCLKRDLHWTPKGAEPWTQNADNLCQPLTEMRDDWVEFCNRVLPDATPAVSGQTTFSFSFED